MQLPPALRLRNYRLFFGGQGISLIGTWMTQLATIWLVYDLTKSPLMLGVVGFSSQIPSFFLAPIGGLFVARFSRHRTLIGTQILAMIQSLALAVLALTGVIQVWHIIALSLVQGFINAFDAPALSSICAGIGGTQRRFSKCDRHKFNHVQWSAIN